MMPEPFFTIVIPTYNRAAHLEAAIRSVLDQTFLSYEVIVVDDGSTDNTKEVIKKISDSRVQYIYQINSERGVARNTGAKAAKGTYISFFDSDDRLLSHHLETASQFIAENNQPPLFCLSSRILNASSSREIIHNDRINSELIFGNVLCCQDVFLRRDIAIQFPFSEERSLSALEDWELWLRLAPHHTFLACPVITSEVIQHDERSVLQTAPEKIEQRFNIFRKLIYNNESIRNYYKGSLNKFDSSCETYIALHLVLTGKYKFIAIKHLIKGIAYQPSAIFSRRFLAIFKHLIS